MKHNLIGKSQHRVAMLFQHKGTRFISFGLRQMNWAVYFDDQMLLRAAKVGDTAADGMLAAEPQTGQPAASQLRP